MPIDRNRSTTLSSRHCLRLRCASRAHPNRLKNRAVPLPRAERLEQQHDLITLALTQVVAFARADLVVFAEQKIEQVEKSLERLVLGPLRNHALWGAVAPYVLD